MGLEVCHIIRIYIPLMPESSEKEYLNDPERSVYVRRIQEVLKKYSQVGRLGKYGSLYEMSQGQEWFTPLEGAEPRLGHLGRETRVDSVVLTTYVIGWDSQEINEFIRELAGAHPWEHPIIECIGPEGPQVWMPD